MSATTVMGKAMETGFQRAVKYFMAKAAIAVYAEADTVSGHAERVAYAAKVLRGEASVSEYAVAVATNTTVAASLGADSLPPDNDLEFTVNSMYNAFAGYAEAT